MKKLAMAVVAALAVMCVMAEEPQRGPRRPHGERNGERRGQFDRPMPPPMMLPIHMRVMLNVLTYFFSCSMTYSFLLIK